MRNISFMLTTQQVIDQTKTVTRRMGWLNAKVGDLLQACEKCQGLGNGGKINKLKVIRLTEVKRKPLNAITQAEVVAEGFPNMTPAEFIEFFCKSHKGCRPDTEVTVLGFEYVCDFCKVGKAIWPVQWHNSDKLNFACQNCTENSEEMIGYECSQCGLYYADIEVEDRNLDFGIFTCDDCRSKP